MATGQIEITRRTDVLLQRQQMKMAESAHAYVRGNTVRFYEWLKSDAVRGSLPKGPDVWICGDCHIGNLGPVADLDGRIEIQIRDLDQTVVGNPAHDLLRLGLSLAMAVRSSDLPGVTTALMLEEMIIGYIDGLRGKSATSLRQVGPIRKVIREAQSRTWRHLAEERIEDATPSIPLGKRFWKLTPEEAQAMREMVEVEWTPRLMQCLKQDGEKTKITLLDAAYWVKGCSSLGRLRYAVLIGLGKKKDHHYRLLDIKEATHAAAPCTGGLEIPSNDAERVVTGACNLSPNLGERMMPGVFGGRNVVIRELRPQDLKFELTELSQREAIATARMLAGVVGKAHGRQMDRPNRQTWIRELKAKHESSIDAPRWLWRGVVDLVALHEAAYLEHCRRYATASAS